MKTSYHHRPLLSPLPKAGLQNEETLLPISLFLSIGIPRKSRSLPVVHKKEKEKENAN